MSVKPISLRMLETLFTCEEVSCDKAYVRKVERSKGREAQRKGHRLPTKRLTGQR